MGPAKAITDTLEDYLEIILELQRESPAVRVRDIARRKGVSTATVTWALRQLAARGLVDYEAREFVRLTASGLEVARGVAGRHAFLLGFLSRMLGVPEDQAERDACGLEHHLSADTLERLAAFIEYLETCPQVGSGFMDRFTECFARRPGVCDGKRDCRGRRPPEGERWRDRGFVPLVDLPDGGTGRVVRIEAPAHVRADLMRSGVLPGLDLEVLDHLPGGALRGRLQGFEFRLGPAQASAIYVLPHPARNVRDGGER